MNEENVRVVCIGGIKIRGLVAQRLGLQRPWTPGDFSAVPTKEDTR